jgi:hypothetical protein
MTLTVSIDTVSATQRLAAKGSGFGTFDEVAVAVAGSVAAKLADELMAALGSRFDTLSGEDVTAILDLYVSTPSVVKPANANYVPESTRFSNGHKKLYLILLNEAGGDKATGSPGASIKAVPEGKGALSSPEDDLTIDESQNGDGCPLPLKLLVDSHFPQWRTCRRATNAGNNYIVNL